MVSLDDIDSQLAVYCPTTVSFGAKTECLCVLATHIAVDIFTMYHVNTKN